MRVGDDVVKDYFTLGTNLSTEEIENHMNEHADAPMELKKVLARQIVRELCSDDEVQSAEEHFVSTVQNKEAGENVETVTIASPITGMQLVDVIVENQLAESKSQARRLIEQGAVRLDDETIHLLSKVEIADKLRILKHLLKDGISEGFLET